MMDATFKDDAFIVIIIKFKVKNLWIFNSTLNRLCYIIITQYFFVSLNFKTITEMNIF